jgi:hypothetical protein
MEVTRAVCASLSRAEGSVMDQLLALRNEVCAPERMRVHYALLYTSGWFLLWVEGSDEAVDAALQRAARDKRNEHQKLLHRSRGPAALHERIVVATTQTPLRPSQFARWVMHMKDHGRKLQPADIWNRMGAPCLIDPDRTPCTRPAQQFALVTADDHGPVEQLRKVGERCGSPVIYQRFGVARRHSPDLGTAYVDIPGEYGPARVRLLSRKALSQAGVRRSMPAVDGLVLLVGARPAPAIELAAHIADTVKSAEQPPPVWLVGPPGEPTDACARLLERSGVAAHKGPPELNGRVDLFSLLPAIGWRPPAAANSGHGPLDALAATRASSRNSRPVARCSG